MKCSVNSCSNESQHNHHVVPTMLDEKYKTVIPLCEKHHNILHNMMPKFIWDYIIDKDLAKIQIEKRTAWYCANWIDKKEVKGLLKELNRNTESRFRCPNCDYVIDEDLTDIDVWDCANCGETFRIDEIKEEEDDIDYKD